MRRAIAVAVALLFLACSSTVLATKGHGFSGGSSKSSGSKSSGGSKPVHVKGYTKTDGTHVEAHERKAPEPKSESAPATHAPTTIRIYTDPATGRKTLTNAPEPPLASRTLTSATSTQAPKTMSSMRIAPSMSAITASRKSGPTHPAHATTRSHVAPTGVTRGAKGRIARSESAKHAFEAQTGYPHG